MEVSIKKVKKSEEVILRNLYSLYLHELSAFTSSIEIGTDGSFEYESLDKFWRTEGISPYFIKRDEHLIGFLLLLERPFLKKEYDFGINDLFILNKYRNQGNGKLALKPLFQRNKGTYFVIQLKKNEPAVLFWKKLYKEWTIQYNEKQELIDEEHCLIQSFQI
ncbi:GNAT family N-acetyltransferase [Alkalihalobacillus trypoxylicola]|uniref:Acetyltransferase n=1 Tax=Alkalihalobacillus trypoxylicola TaxID=519424 RepID=A0A162E777_9BACI|nr:GNAT family N-acetyltransferase [Alkalihalobacillus trypoxylicola]KYG31941.1 acetyltransferase [Alkalihalobacillus trypoxylicola]GAF65835.1 putative acetyltransferase [Bacillus sp. TS-2]